MPSKHRKIETFLRCFTAEIVDYALEKYRQSLLFPPLLLFGTPHGRDTMGTKEATALWGYTQSTITPAVFMLAYHVINIIQINEIIDFSYYFSIRLLLDICFPLFVTIAGLILTGLWLKNDSSESEATTAAMNSQAFSRTSVYSSAVSVADKLKAYKDLLDCGAITEEEFKAKKSELLK